MRYKAQRTDGELAALGLGEIEPDDVQQLHSVQHIDKLNVMPEHFRGFCYHQNDPRHSKLTQQGDRRR